MTELSDLYRDPNAILTHTGRYIDPLNTTPQDFCLEDIAWGLAHTFRFRGNTAYSRPITVAEHSAYVANAVWNKTQDPSQALTALFHDASEAYLGDMPTPIKRRLPDYQRAENKMMLDIWTWLQKETGASAIFDAQTYPLIQKADKEALEHEWLNIVTKQGSWEPPLTCLPAYHNFIGRYNKYVNHLSSPKSKDV